MDIAAMGQAAVAGLNREPAPFPPVTTSTSGRVVYEASGPRKLAFSLVFLLLLPFFASLGPMLFWRVSQGVWTGTPGLLVLAIGFSIVMFLLLTELLHALLARIELGERSVKLTLPSGRGPTPVLRYRSHDIPYDQIRTVETRREIYGGSATPVLLHGARLILKDDTAVKLGYVSEANSDPCFPYPQIAAQIAERAGLRVQHRGNVRRSVQKKYLGISRPLFVPDDGPVEEAEIEVLNKSHRKWVLRVIGALVGLVGIGIALDIAFPPSSGLPPALSSISKAFMSAGTTPATPPQKK